MATTSDDFFTAQKDMNTAKLQWINAWYGTAYTDLSSALQRFMRDNAATSPAGQAGTVFDSTRQASLLERSAQGTTS